jgi:HlyD family secretion protein
LRSQAPIPIPGRVTRIESSSDSITEERLAGIALDQLPPGVGIGELVEATVDLPPLKGVLSMPSAALRRVEQRTGAWRIEAGKTVFAPLRIGVQTLDGRTQVLEGLAADDTVIEHTPEELRAGQRVRVVPRVAANGP